MKTMIRNIIRMLFVLIFFISCNSEEKVENFVEETAIASETVSIPVDRVLNGTGDTRTLWSFNSKNLTLTRIYESGDILYLLNPYLPAVFYTYAAMGSVKYNYLSYNPSTNAFGGVAVFQKKFTPPTTVYDPLVPSDSVTLVLFDKNYADWSYKVEKDSSLILGLKNQKGTQNDAFAHQATYLYLPYRLYAGTHLWTQTIMAYYWLIFTFPDQDVKSIDNIKIHADEPMPSSVAWKYKGYLSERYTEYNGPNAIGTNSFSSSGADAFIAFYVGNGTATFNNFGFDITYTLTDNTQHTGSVNVRPQVKTASAGNVYKNAFMISKAHGVQNTYVDEIVEIDKWNNTYNGTVIAPKSGFDIDADTTTAE